MDSWPKIIEFIIRDCLRIIQGVPKKMVTRFYKEDDPYSKHKGKQNAAKILSPFFLGHPVHVSKMSLGLKTEKFY